MITILVMSFVLDIIIANRNIEILEYFWLLF